MKRTRPVGPYGGGGSDQERRDAEQDGNGQGCAIATAEGDPGRDHRCDQYEVPDADEDPNLESGFLGEVLR